MIFIVYFLALFVPLAAAPATEVPLQVFFSPEDHLADRLISLIEKEENSIAVAAYAFSHWKIAKALCDAKERGVKVEVVVDPFSLKFSSILKKLTKSKIPIWVWDPSTSSTGTALMHDKFCLFGESSVWTGSFNFTYYADHSNRENALFLNDAQIVKKFKAHFENLKKTGCKKYKAPSN